MTSKTPSIREGWSDERVACGLPRGPAMRAKSLVGLALSVSLVAVGCATADNDAPIIDYVESPLVVTAENGAYKIPITIGFHDNDDEVVTRVRYRLAPSIDGVVDISTPIPTRQTAAVTLVIPAGASGASGAGQQQLEITIIDGRGAESLVLPRPVTFE